MRVAQVRTASERNRDVERDAIQPGRERALRIVAGIRTPALRDDFLRQVSAIFRLPHDAPLREDVRRLGALVGEMLAEQLGAEFLARVESIRTAAIRSRDSVATPEALTTQVAGLDPQFAAQLTRAFATYFQVVNIA